MDEVGVRLPVGPQKNMQSIHKHINPGNKILRFFFFLTGIIATIAYRITPFLQPTAVKISWYVGTVGFIIYFWHRSQIETKRAKLVKEFDLANAVEQSSLQGEQKEAVTYLVKTSLTSKARWDSLFIVVASALALVGALIVDLHLI